MNNGMVMLGTMLCVWSTFVVSQPSETHGRDPFSIPTMNAPPRSALVETAQVAPVLKTEMITIRYANIETLVLLLQGNHGHGLLSTAGMVSMDKRTNTLIIRDTMASLAEIKPLIQQLDVPVKQVEIEARIVMMSEGASEELGVRWGIGTSQKYFSMGGTIEGHHSASSEKEMDMAHLLNVSLPASSSAAASIAFQLATLGSGTLLDLELSALQSESRAEIISSPRLLTTNRKPAFIEQGAEIPYLASADNGENNIAFKKAVLSLKVTPYITPDHRLILDLNVTQDRPGEVVKTGTGEAVAIVTQRIGTQVVVNDGETIVLGGIYQENNIHGVDKVPVLGDTPVIGSLFRRTYQEKGKSELVIFVTPNIKIQ